MKKTDLGFGYRFFLLTTSRAAAFASPWAMLDGTAVVAACLPMLSANRMVGIKTAIIATAMKVGFENSVEEVNAEILSTQIESVVGGESIMMIAIQ